MLQDVSRECLGGIHGEKSNFNEKAEQEVTTRDKYHVSGRYTAARLCTCCLRKFLRPVGLLEREFNRFIAKTWDAKPLPKFRLSSCIHVLLSQHFEKELKSFRKFICHDKIKIVKLTSEI